MVAPPGRTASEARAACGEGVTVSEIPIDDSWMRDSGPIFVLDGAGRPRRRRLRLQRVGREVPALRRRRRGRRAAARAAGGGAHRRPRLHPRGRLDRRRRRGHADHHGAVPAASEAQPGAVARRDRPPAAGRARRPHRGVARPGPRRGPRHRRPRRQHLRLHRARARAAPDGGRRGQPELGQHARERRAAAGGRPGGRGAAAAAVRRPRRAAHRGPLHELLRLQRRRSSSRWRARTPTRRR